MSVPRLDNYLRTFRKRAGFTQREVAFLMGSGEGDNHDKLSRLERNKNLPELIVNALSRARSHIEPMDFAKSLVAEPNPAWFLNALGVDKILADQAGQEGLVETILKIAEKNRGNIALYFVQLRTSSN